MPNFTPRRSPRLELLSAARPLIARVRGAVLAADGPCPAAAVLQTAPLQACQRLADLWATAGPHAAGLRASLGDEDRVVFDIVVTTYPPTRPAAADLTGLADALLAGP